MTFKVRWTKVAIEQLAAIWVAADSQLRKQITRAASAIDELLQVDPQLQGESRPGGLRIAFEFPLGFLFRVNPQNGTVRVVKVWPI